MKRRSFGGRRTTGRIPCVYKRTRRRGLRRTRRSESESGHVRAVRSVDIRRTRALRTSAGRPPPLRARGTQASARAPRGEARCLRGVGAHSRLREQRGQMRHKRRQRRTLPLFGPASPWVPARVTDLSRGDLPVKNARLDGGSGRAFPSSSRGRAVPSRRTLQEDCAEARNRPSSRCGS